MIRRIDSEFHTHFMLAEHGVGGGCLLCNIEGWQKNWFTLKVTIFIGQSYLFIQWINNKKCTILSWNFNGKMWAQFIERLLFWIYFFYISSSKYVENIQDVNLNTSHPSFLPFHKQYEISESFVNFISKEETIKFLFFSTVPEILII